MSKSVEERVVQMEFENESFERKAKQTTKTLNKLDDSLAFKNGKKSFEDVERAASKTNFSSFIKAADTVTDRLSTLGIVGVTALTNITNKAVNAGERLIKSLSTDQIVAGWTKMDQITRSSGTLIAQGYDMSEVESQIDRLNWFTDETSYNLTDMVDNISKFTATGKGLTDSATAMEGIALWAALSGQNATTASRAMFQLSQALGAGYMRLEDYKSIQNASMDTDEFRQKTLDAAVALGTLKKNSDDTYTALTGNGTTFNKAQFAQSLTEGMWFTSDVMMEVFKKYSSTVDQVYEYASEHGITASQAIEELGDQVDEFGLKAFRAGQEARTFGDAIDATKDAVSTGWMTMFKTIFGNYDQQRVLWTDLANGLYDFFAEPLNGINEIIGEAFGSATNELKDQIDSAAIDWSSFSGVLSDVATKHGLSVDSMIADAKSLDDVLQQGWLDSDTFADAIDEYSSGLTTATGTVITAEEQLAVATKIASEILRGDWGNGADRMKRLTEAGYDYATFQSYADKLFSKGSLSLSDFNDVMEDSVGIDEEKVASLKELSNEVRNAGEGFTEMTETINKPDGRTLFIKGLQNILGGIVDRINWIKYSWSTVFPAMTADRLGEIIAKFNELSQAFKMGDKEKIAVNRIFRGIATPIKAAIGTIKEFIGAFTPLMRIVTFFGGEALTALGNFGAKISRLFSGNWYKGAFDPLKNTLSSVVDAIIEGYNAAKRFGTYLTRRFGKIDILGSLNKAFSKFGVDISGVFNSATDGIQKFTTWLTELDDSDFAKVGDVIAKVGEKLAKVFKVAKTVASSIWSITMSILAPIAGFLNNNLIQPFVSFISAVIHSEDPLATLIDGFKNVGKAFKKFWNALKKSKAAEYVTSAVGFIKEALTGLVKFIKGEKESLSLQDVIGMAASVGALAALQKVTGVFDKVGQLVDTMKGTFASLNKLFKARQLSGISANIQAIAQSITMVVAAVIALAHIPVDKMLPAVGAIVGLAVVMAGLAIAFAALGKRFMKNVPNAASLSVAMTNLGKVFTRMATAILIIAGAIAIISFSKVNADANKVINTIVLIGGMAIVLYGLAWYLSTISGSFKSASLALVLISSSILIMAIAVGAIAKVVGKGDTSLYILAGMLVAIAVVGRIASKLSLKPFIALGMIAASLVVICFMLKQVENLSFGNILSKWKEMLAVFGFLVVLILAVRLLSRWTTTLTAGSLRVIAGVAALTAAMYVISLMFTNIASMKLSSEKIRATAGAILIMGLVIAAFTALIGYFGQIKPGNKAKFASLAMSVMLLVGSLGAMMLLLKLAKNMAVDEYVDALGTMALVVTMLAGLMIAFGVMGKLGDGKGAALAIIGVISIMALMGTIVVMQKFIDPNSIWLTLGVMLAVVVMLSGLLIAIGFAAKLASSSQGSLGTLIGIVVVLGALGAALYFVGQNPWQQTAAAAVGMAVAILAIALVLKMLDGANISGKAILSLLAIIPVMLAFAVSMGILAAALQVVSSCNSDIKTLLIMMGALAVFAVVMVVLAKIASSSPLVAVALIVIAAVLVLAAASVLAFAVAMEKLEATNLDKVAKGLKALAGPMALVGLAGILMILGGIGMVLGALGIVAIGAAAGIAATGIFAFASAVDTLLYSIARIGYAAAKHGLGGEVAAALGDVYTEMNAQKDAAKKASSETGAEIQNGQAEGIANNTGVVTDAVDASGQQVNAKIEEAGESAKETAVEQTEDTIAAINETVAEETVNDGGWLDSFKPENFDVASVIGGIVEKIKSYLGEGGLGDIFSGLDLSAITDGIDITGFVDGLKSKFGNMDFTNMDLSNLTGGMSSQLSTAADDVDADAAAAVVATKYTDALSSNLSSETNVSAMSESGRALADGADSGFREVDTSSAGEYFVAGIVNGINDHAAEVYSAAIKLGQNGLAALNGSMEVASPSKATYRTGRWFVIGLSKAILDYAGIAYNSASDLANGTMYALNAAMENDISNPRITPVLDMSEVYATMSGFDIDGTMRPIIRPSMDTRGISPAMRNMDAISTIRSNRETAAMLQNGSDAAGSNNPNYSTTFNQYNYSPKALSRKEIYRRTNNLINSAGARRAVVK